MSKVDAIFLACCGTARASNIRLDIPFTVPAASSLRRFYSGKRFEPSSGEDIILQ
jgi:hypothetical protein